MRTGGWADKLGNRYEEFWTAKQLLLLLHGELQTVQLESLHDEKEAVDLMLFHFDGSRHAHQCKKRDSHQGWTIRELGKRGVLTAARDHLRQDSRRRFVFVSNREATDWKRLIEAARRFEQGPGQFLDYVANLAGEGTNWNSLCDEVGLASQSAEAFDLLVRSDVLVYDDGIGGRKDVEIFAKLLLDGDPRDIVLRLADYAIERMGNPIHADELRTFIRTQTSFKLRDLTLHVGIAPAIE